MKKTRTYGLYAGLIFSASLLLLSFSKVENPESTLNYSFLCCFPFLILFILMTMLSRRKELGNHIDFNEAFKTGLGVSAIAGIVYALANYFYLQFVNHAIVDTMMAMRHDSLVKAGKPAAEITAQMEQFKNLPFTVATYRLVTLIFIGGILSIVLALFVRRRHIEVLTETE